MKPIYLEPDEEITSVVDKLASTPELKLAIVVPKNSTLFQSLVNVKLVAKQAKELNKEVVFISTNKVGERLANQVGLKTYASLGTLEEALPATSSKQPEIEETLPDGTPIHRYAPGQTISPSQTNQQPASEKVGATAEKESAAQVNSDYISTTVSPKESSVEALPPIIRQGEAKNLSRPDFSFKLPWRSAVVALVVVIIGLLFTYIIIPKATVSLVLPSEKLSQTLTMTADTTVSKVDGNTVTAKLFETQKSANKVINATGQKNVGTKATGNVAIKNCEDTNSYNLASGARLIADNKVFLANKAVLIPAGKFSGGGTICNSDSVSVGVTAEEAGESYNLSNATFKIASLPSRVSGTGSTTGGTTKKVTFLTKEDLDRAFVELEQQIKNEALTELQSKIGQLKIIDGASWITLEEKRSDHETNAETETTTIYLSAKIAAIAINEDEVFQLLIKKMEAEIDRDHRLIFEKSFKPEIKLVALSEDKKSYNFETKATGFIIANINEREVRLLVAHKSLAEAETILKERFSAERIEVEIKPSWWWQRLPLLGSSIEVEYKFNEVPGT